MMNIAFRVDASKEIGTGHFMRCLTLADGLKQRGAHIRFISRKLPAYLRDMVADKGMELVSLESNTISSQVNDLAHAHWLRTSQAEDAQATIQVLSDRSWDWLIVDHYALDSRWESALRCTTRQIMVIDDLADRQHDCDLLLDQNYYRNHEFRYQGLLPQDCVTLLGPTFLLLRPEFFDARKMVRARDGTVRRILVFFGGSDLTNQTQKVVEAIKLLDKPDIFVDVVVGMDNTNRNEIESLCKDLPNVSFCCQVSNMAELILHADLGIGAGGVAMWERAYLGLPSITVVIAINQLRTTEDVAETRAIEYLGCSASLGSEDYAQAIHKMIRDPYRVKQISDAALSLLQLKNSPLENMTQILIGDKNNGELQDMHRVMS